MAESLDSRKFDRKPMFDVPLPMRRAPRDASSAAEDSPGEGAATPPNTMAFSLMTKRGNRQQVFETGYNNPKGDVADLPSRLGPSNCLRIRTSQWP